MDLLKSYPALFRQILWTREEALNAYRSAGDWSGVPCFSTGSVSDQTGKRATLLAMISERENLVKAIRHWIDTRMPSEDRDMLLLVWKGHDWQDIERMTGRQAWRCEARWEMLNKAVECYSRA